MSSIDSDHGDAVALLKPSEVAARLGVSRSWLYEAARHGRIPCIRIGGQEGPLRFVAEDLQCWIDEARDRWSPGRPACPTRSTLRGRLEPAQAAAHGRTRAAHRP
jgi:excisionase family DNA binding protein